MKSLALPASMLLMSVVTGCGSTKMTPNGPEQEPREAGCDFRVFTTAPEGYAEIAAIDIKPGGYGHNVFTDIADFKEIRPSVCRAGGDAAIAYANGYGMYIKATVLKRVAGAEVAQAPSGPSPTAADSAASESGCKYDTQCKGDRICVNGACVDASPAAAPAAATPAAAAPAAAAPAASAAAPAAGPAPAAPATPAAR